MSQLDPTAIRILNIIQVDARITEKALAPVYSKQPQFAGNGGDAAGLRCLAAGKSEQLAERGGGAEQFHGARDKKIWAIHTGLTIVSFICRIISVN